MYIVARGRAHILELGRPKLGRESLAAALGAILEQAVAVHADGRREVGIIRKSAVFDDVGRRRLRPETASPQLRGEGHRRRRARRERRIEAVDPVAEQRIVVDEPRPVDLELQESGIAVAAPDVDVADRRIGRVLKLVAARREEPALLGVQLHVKRNSSDRRHRQLFVFEILLFVIRQIFLGIVRSFVTG